MIWMEYPDKIGVQLFLIMLQEFFICCITIHKSVEAFFKGFIRSDGEQMADDSQILNIVGQLLIIVGSGCCP